MFDQEQISYCYYVYQFRNIRRYAGLMPLHLLRACDEKAVERLFKQGLVAFMETTLEDGRKMRGVILTDQGSAMLEGL